MEQMLHRNHLTVGGVTFPQLQLHAGTNKPANIQELRKSQGNLYNTENSVSINTVEFSRTETAITALASTPEQPGKFRVDIDTTKLGCGSSKILLTRLSSQNSPISVLLNIITATEAQRNLNVIFIVMVSPMHVKCNYQL